MCISLHRFPGPFIGVRTNVFLLAENDGGIRLALNLKGGPLFWGKMKLLFLTYSEELFKTFKLVFV